MIWLLVSSHLISSSPGHSGRQWGSEGIGELPDEGLVLLHLDGQLVVLMLHVLNLLEKGRVKGIELRLEVPAT
jgi:hypothetical protein